VAFPPVFFDVEVQGVRYDEMHVDGAVAANVFYNGGVFSSPAARQRVGRAEGREDIYIIHNGQLGPVAEVTPRTLRGIAMRVFESAEQGRGREAICSGFTPHRCTSRRFHWVHVARRDRSSVGNPALRSGQGAAAPYDIGYSCGALNRSEHHSAGWTRGTPRLPRPQPPVWHPPGIGCAGGTEAVPPGARFTVGLCSAVSGPFSLRGGARAGAALTFFLRKNQAVIQGRFAGETSRA
jgi:hypothetical protein